MCNNFLSLLLNLQLVTIMQRLEFSYISKGLQVLVYFSPPLLLFISKPFVIVIGAPAVIQDNQWLVLVCILGILSYIGNQRSKEQYQRVLVKLNTGQWPLLHWNLMANLSFSRFQSSFWATTSFILWQWLSKIHCGKSSISWAYKTYKNRLSRGQEKLKKGLIHLLPISTTEQLVDIYTKSFKSSIF